MIGHFRARTEYALDRLIETQSRYTLYYELELF